GMAGAVRALPLELREPLLIVVLAGFTHQEAASALDISLATLITRLTKARERVAALTRPHAAAAPRAAAPHLRVVKGWRPGASPICTPTWTTALSLTSVWRSSSRWPRI